MSGYVSFGEFRFEPSAARLWHHRSEVKLTPKGAAVLGVLIQRAGELVTKQMLFDAVWAHTVVSDDALVTCIQDLRKALGDDAKHPRYIETRHRSGYLFIAEVRSEFGNASVAVDGHRPTDTSIAVLPFLDVSPNRDQDFFCEGVAEELIDALTNLDGLRVASRGVSFHFRSDGADVREVGRRFGVDALLEGSVRKAEDRLRITVQLIEVESGYHRWSQRFEGNLADIFAVQNEIAETVAITLRGGALTHSERSAVQRPPTTIEPYDCFLRGRQRLHRMQQPDMDESRRLFEQAIALDPHYAPAWAGLATVHAMLFEWWGAADEDLQSADRASQRAMDLAPDLADAHVARGCALSLRRLYEEAHIHFEGAARLSPHLFDAYYYHARSAFAQGQVQRSADLFRKASEVRQDDFQSAVLLAQSLRMLGRHEEASAANREGIARAERILALNPADGRALALGSCALVEEGDLERGLAWSRRSLDLHPDDMSALLNAVCLRTTAGLKEEALDLLERAFSRGWGKRDWIDRDPSYDILRDDPRFKRLYANLK